MPFGMNPGTNSGGERKRNVNNEHRGSGRHEEGMEKEQESQRRETEVSETESAKNG